MTFSGNTSISLGNDFKNAFTGGITIEGGATVTVNNDNSSGGGHSSLLNSLGAPDNVITLDGGILNLTGFNYEGRSVVLGPGGGTVSGSVDISGSGPLYTFNGGNNAGYSSLTGNNTYMGGTFINGILLGITTEGNIGGDSAPITINANSNPSGISIIGNSLTSLSNPINFTANGAGKTAFDIQSPTNTFTLGQALNLGTGGFSKYGAGTLVLTGAETFTGSTNLFGGILEVDASQGGSFASTDSLNFQGGTFYLKGSGGTTVQTLGNLTANLGGISNDSGHPITQGNITGAGNIVVDNNGGSATLNVGALPDTAGAILPGNAFAFIAKGSGASKITTTAAPSDGSSGTGGATGNATYDGRYVYVVENAAGTIISADWATSTTSSSTSPNTIVGFGSGIGGYVTYNNSYDGADGNENTRMTGNVTGGSDTTVNSLKIANTSTGTFNEAGETLTLNGGGLLFTGTTGYTISGGSIVSGLSSLGTFGGGSGATNSTDLIVQQYGTGTLTISSAILNAADGQASTFTRRVLAPLVLSGNNGYLGWTFVDGGILSVSSSNNLGGENGTILVASSSTTSKTVVLDASVTSLPIGFGIYSNFLGSTVTGISQSGGVYTITLSANATAAVSGSSSTASWASTSGMVYLNGGTLQVTNTLVAQTNSAGAAGVTATAALPNLELGGAGGGVNIINGASYTASITTYLEGQSGPASFTMDSTDGTGTFNMTGSSFIGTIIINGGTLNSNGGNPTSIAANDPIYFGSGDESATGGAANTHPTLSGNNNFWYTGGVDSPATTTALITSSSNNALVITDGGTDSYSGLITGTLRVIKGGSGTQYFTNTGSYYTGATRIDDGVLNVGNLANVGVTPSISTTIGLTSATLGSTTGLVNGTVYTVVSTNVPAGTTFTFTGSASVTLSNAATATGSVTATSVGASSSIGIATQNSGGNLLFGGYAPGTAVLQYTGATAVSTDRLFTLGDIDNASVLAGNDGTIDASGSVPGATVSFTNTGSIVVNANATSAAFVHNLTLTGSNTGANVFDPILPDEATSTTTISGSSGANTITVASATGLVVNQVVTGTGIATGAQVVAINGTTITLSLPNTGTVSGTGTFLGTPTSLTKTGVGTWQLAGTTANTYTGLTTVSAGELDLNKTAGVNAIAGTATLDINNPDVLVNGGTLKWLANEQVGNSTTISLTSGTVNLNGQTETLGDFSNSGGAFTTGVGGKLVGTGSSITWSGGTNTVNADGSVEDGHVSITGGANTVQGLAGTPAGVTRGGILQVDDGGLGLQMTGSTLTLNSDATSAGELLLGKTANTSANVTTSASSVTSNISNGGSAANSGFVDLNGGTSIFTVASGTTPSGIDLAVSAVIQDGALTKAGAGTMAVTAANTYTGTTTISGGTFQLGAGGATGSLALGSAIVDNGNLAIDRSNPVTQGVDFTASPITGSGTLTQAGAGTTTLTGANTYGGGTTVSAGCGHALL